MPNLGGPELLILMVFDVAVIVLTAWLAARKGYSAAVWAIVAFFINVIALVIVLVLPTRPQAPPPDRSPGV